jgi:hypothetical protein
VVTYGSGMVLPGYGVLSGMHDVLGDQPVPF